jgi:hypothetical protein
MQEPGEALVSPPYRPPGESGELETGWFPVSMALIAGIQACSFTRDRRFTPADIAVLPLLVSRFNYPSWGPFSLGDHEIARLLGVSTKTVQRGRDKLVGLGWLKAEPGKIIRVDPPEYRRTRYLELNCPGFDNGKPGVPWFRQERRTFAFLLRAVVNADIDINHSHVPAYLAVRYFMQQRGREGKFTASKGELVDLFGMKGMPELVGGIPVLLPLPDGGPLYRCEFGYRNLKITDLRDYPECKPGVCVH